MCPVRSVTCVSGRSPGFLKLRSFAAASTQLRARAREIVHPRLGRAQGDDIRGLCRHSDRVPKNLARSTECLCPLLEVIVGVVAF